MLTLIDYTFDTKIRCKEITGIILTSMPYVPSSQFVINDKLYGFLCTAGVFFENAGKLQQRSLFDYVIDIIKSEIKNGTLEYNKKIQPIKINRNLYAVLMTYQDQFDSICCLIHNSLLGNSSSEQKFGYMPKVYQNADSSNTNESKFGNSSIQKVYQMPTTSNNNTYLSNESKFGNSSIQKTYQMPTNSNNNSYLSNMNEPMFGNSSIQKTYHSYSGIPDQSKQDKIQKSNLIAFPDFEEEFVNNNPMPMNIFNVPPPPPNMLTNTLKETNFSNNEKYSGSKVPTYQQTNYENDDLPKRTTVRKFPPVQTGVPKKNQPFILDPTNIIRSGITSQESLDYIEQMRKQREIESQSKVYGLSAEIKKFTQNPRLKPITNPNPNMFHFTSKQEMPYIVSEQEEQ